MTPEEILLVRRQQTAVREAGLCGQLIDDQTKLCIRAKGHDNGEHDRAWLVKRVTLPDPHARDSRESITVYQVLDPKSSKRFETYSSVHAEWLASTLTRLDL